MDGRRLLALAVAMVVLALVAVMAWTLRPDTTPDPAPEHVLPETERRVRKVYPLPNPRPVVPEPAAAPEPDVVPEPGPVPKEVSIEFAGATMNALAEVRVECVDPWLESDGPEEAEFALNAVVVDGAVADIELLTVIDDLPDDVVDCIRDVAWSTDWPEVEMVGEVRYQRAVKAKRRSVVPDDL